MNEKDIAWPGEERKIEKPKAEKVNPFTGSKFSNNSFNNPRNDNNNTNDNKGRALDRQITLSLSPRKTLKALFFIFLFAVIFFAGKFSGDLGGFTDSISGLFVGVDSADEKILPEAEVAEVAPVQENVTPTQDTVPEEAAAPPEEEGEDIDSQDLITSYNRVSIALEDKTIQWKETWGKITAVEITIKNSELGRIEPARLVMAVEGYDDFDKEIPLPATLKKIGSTNTLRAKLFVPNGFAYNEVSTGSLGDVMITLSLFDDFGKLMARTQKPMNLQG